MLASSAQLTKETPREMANFFPSDEICARKKKKPRDTNISYHGYYNLLTPIPLVYRQKHFIAQSSRTLFDYHSSQPYELCRSTTTKTDGEKKHIKKKYCLKVLNEFRNDVSIKIMLIFFCISSFGFLSSRKMCRSGTNKSTSEEKKIDQLTFSLPRSNRAKVCGRKNAVTEELQNE